jgi:hypothetical protein
VIAWLKGAGRDRALLVEDRLINARFDVPLKALQPLIEGQLDLADEGNKLLLGVQDRQQLDNTLNEELVGALNEGPGQALFRRPSPSNYYLLLVIVAAVALVFYGLRRLRLASFKPDPKLPVLAAAVQRHAPTGPALRLRTRLVLEQDTLGDDARAVAQEWLAAQPAVAPFVRGHEPRRPVLVAEGGWWRRRWLRKLFWRMWKLAYGESAPVSEWEFRRLLVRLDRLRDALAAGELRLMEPNADRAPRIDTE